MSAPPMQIEAVCQIHQSSGQLVVRCEGERIVLDAHADHCCMITLENTAVTVLFNTLAQWLR